MASTYWCSIKRIKQRGMGQQMLWRRNWCLGVPGVPGVPLFDTEVDSVVPVLRRAKTTCSNEGWDFQLTTVVSSCFQAQIGYMMAVAGPYEPSKRDLIKYLVGEMLLLPFRVCSRCSPASEVNYRRLAVFCKGSMERQ